VRELAAFLLDHSHRAGVPLTAMVERTHPVFKTVVKLGSLQQFISHECQSWDLGPSQYSRRDVHLVGVMDVRLFNVDRHGGNMLAQRCAAGSPRPSYRLVPIDHGFTLPDSVAATDLWFEWMTWPQAKLPFDEETSNYIQSINVDHDARVLHALGIRDECVATMMIATVLLKKSCARGLTLAEIGHLITRRDPDRPSALEDASAHQFVNSTHLRFFLHALEQTVEEALERAGKPSLGADRHQRQPSFHLRSQTQTPRLALPAPLRRTSSALPSETGSAITDPFFAQCQTFLLNGGGFMRRNMSQESIPTLAT